MVKPRSVIIVARAFALACAAAAVASCNCAPHEVHGPLPDESAAAAESSLETEPILTIHTERGTLVAYLFSEDAPATVAHITKLANAGVFDGKTFAAPTEDYVACEFDCGSDLPVEENKVQHSRAFLGIRRNADTGAQCQFYISFAPAPYLDADNTVFGCVVSGMDLVQSFHPGEKIVSMRVAAPAWPDIDYRALPANPAPDLTPGADGMSKASGVIVTEQGTIQFKFLPQVAPKHTDRIAELITQGFYDGLQFHRAIEGFLLQTGCPKGDGTSGSGVTIAAEFSKKKHRRGTVGMARAAHPDSADSQFYIAMGSSPHLDGQYTVFGQVVDGLPVLKKIRVGDKVLRMYLR